MTPPHPTTQVAVIEIGTNSIKFAVARVTPAGGFRITRFSRATTRLGSGLAASKTVSTTSVDRVIHSIQRFRRSIAADIPRFAFSTYALRRARNARAVAGKIQKALGCPLTILTGREEARLAYLSATRRLDLRRPTTLLIDVGGGSTETIVAERGHIRRTRSLPLGALHLTERFLSGDPVDRDTFDTLSRFVDRTVAGALRDLGAATRPPGDLDLVASGGSAVTVARMSADRSARRGEIAPTVGTGALARRLAQLRVLTVGARKRLPGLEPDRADILPAGMAILLSFARHLGKRRVRINTGGLLEGALWCLTESDLKWPR